VPTVTTATAIATTGATAITIATTGTNAITTATAIAAIDTATGTTISIT
jgi:hypothetical protein